MIGIDFTFITASQLERGQISGSIEIFTCGMLDSIVEKGIEDRFILIVHPAAYGLLKKKYPTFRYYRVGSLFMKLVFKATHTLGMKPLKRSGIYEALLKHHGISRIWYPWVSAKVIPRPFGHYVATCHDLLSIETPEDRACYASIFENADQIVTISEFVKNEVKGQFHIPDEKITVIYNSLSFDGLNLETKPVKALEGKSFLLDCNAFASRKNTLVMIKAFERICGQIEDDLVLCGGYKHDDYYDLCCEYIKSRGLEDRIHIFVGIEEPCKNWLFNHCHVFITPSENEGFGRTPIEAALCLKPVISTRATSLEEATRGLVHYYEDPRNDEELARVILKVLEAPDSEEQLRSIKDEFVSCYDPEKILDEYIAVFDKLKW